MNKTYEQQVQFSVDRLVPVVEDDRTDNLVEGHHMDRNDGAVADGEET